MKYLKYIGESLKPFELNLLEQFETKSFFCTVKGDSFVLQIKGQSLLTKVPWPVVHMNNSSFAQSYNYTITLIKRGK